MTHTGAITRHTPDTKNISMLDGSSGTIQSSESKGDAQNSAMLSPMKVKALRDSRSATAVSRERAICLTISNPATISASAMVSGCALATPTASQNPATPRMAAAVRRFCLRASHAGLSNSHLSMSPTPISATVTPIVNGAADFQTVRPIVVSAAPSMKVSQPRERAREDARASAQTMMTSHTGGSSFASAISRFRKN